jgi:hypothetical protein
MQVGEQLYSAMPPVARSEIVPVPIGVKNKGVIAAEAPVATRLLTPVTMDLRRKLARKGVETGDVIGRQLRRFGWAEEELVFGDVALFPLGRLDLSIDPAVLNSFI